MSKALIGVGRHERIGDRLNYRSGYGERGLDRRLGSLQLGIPKLRQGHLRNVSWPTCQTQHTTVAAAMRQAFLQADAKTASVGPLNKQVKRRADVIGIFQNEASITPINGGRASRAKCERLLQHRYTQIDRMAELTPPLIGQTA